MTIDKTGLSGELAELDVAAFEDARFEQDRLLAAASAALGPLLQVRSDDDLARVWVERFERWLPIYWRKSRLPGVPGGWGAEVVVLRVEVATLRNAGTANSAEAVLRAQLRVRRWLRIPGFGSAIRHLQRGGPELWLTLVAPPAGDWLLQRVDFDAAGEYHLAADMVAEPVLDPALHDTAVQELAGSDARVDPGELLVGSDGEAARRALDLSLVDGRYAPQALEAAVHSILRAWRDFALGRSGAYDQLAALSSYEIADYARSADLPARLHSLEVVGVVRIPRAALFVRMTATVQAHDGSREKALWWQLELDDDLAQHWRLVDAYARPELRDANATSRRAQP